MIKKNLAEEAPELQITESLESSSVTLAHFYCVPWVAVVGHH